MEKLPHVPEKLPQLYLVVQGRVQMEYSSPIAYIQALTYIEGSSRTIWRIWNNAGTLTSWKGCQFG